MSRRKLIDQYISGVLNNRPTHGRKSLSDMYKSIYVEDTQQELPGIDGGEQDDTIAVFYIDKSVLTEELVTQFRALGGDGPVHIPRNILLILKDVSEVKVLKL